MEVVHKETIGHMEEVIDHMVATIRMVIIHKVITSISLIAIILEVSIKVIIDSTKDFILCIRPALRNFTYLLKQQSLQLNITNFREFLLIISSALTGIFFQMFISAFTPANYPALGPQQPQL
ncbi:hypothetical protein ABPG72_015266 [Tetrahymena utriculariae]